MLFILGIIAVFQMIAFPGVLILKAARFRGGVIQTLVTGFATSLLANYVFVSGLTLLRIYRPETVWIGLVVETGLFLWLYRADLKTPLGQAIQSGWDALLASWRERGWKLRGENDTETTLNALRFLAFALALFLALDSLVWGWQLFWKNIGSVFGAWDAVISWNRWAVEWARGSMPGDVQYYPQLLPANWSLIYVLLQDSTLQLFAKSIMPLFCLFTLLLQFDLGWGKNSLGLLLGVTLTRYLEKRFLGDFLAEGYADIPVAFFGLLCVYLLLKASRPPDRANYRRLLWFSAAAGAASAVTKPVGLYLLAIWPLLAYFIADSGALFADRKTKIKEILIPLAAGLVVVLPFYLSRYLAIAQGTDTSNLAYLTQDIYRGAGLWERGMDAFRALDIYRYVFVFAVSAFLWVKPPYRWLIGLFLLPFSLIWAFLFSYDTRNIALALPILGLAAGAGVEGAFEIGLKLLRPIRVGRLWAGLPGVVIIVLAIGAGAILLDDARLKERQVELQKQIFSPSLNRSLYAYLADHPLEGRILTNYPLNFLPGLEGKQNSFWYNDLAVFKSVQKQADTAYLLIPPIASPEITAIVEKKLASGEYELIFENNEGGYPYRFIRIISHTP